MPENTVNTEMKVQEKEAQMTAPAPEARQQGPVHIVPQLGIGCPTPSVIEKLGKVRKQVADIGLSKGGKNDYTGFEYFELADFLPKINRLCEAEGILPVVTYDMRQNYAFMTILDKDSPGYIQFSCPLGAVNVQGAQGIQQMGAMQTYSRRYLYLTAFEIAENDSLDAEAGKEDLIREFLAVGGNLEGLLAYLKTTRNRLTADQLREAIELKKKESEKPQVISAPKKQ